MYKLSVITLVCLAIVVSANDIHLGFASPNSRKIYSEIKEANPALWKRTDEVVINTSGNDVISAVYVYDLREEKDGEAFINEGGIGTRSVTIGLKSPTILRGYKFQIHVFANDPNARLHAKGGYYEDGDTQYARKF